MGFVSVRDEWSLRIYNFTCGTSSFNACHHIARDGLHTANCGERQRTLSIKCLRTDSSGEGCYSNSQVWQMPVVEGKNQRKSSGKRASICSQTYRCILFFFVS